MDPGLEHEPLPELLSAPLSFPVGPVRAVKKSGNKR